ncbi:MAG: cadherin repeat domain-containing protein [Ekhidna sp.]|nr:cadherin repeat domain-containing protein [Ekhidna sp.]
MSYRVFNKLPVVLLMLLFIVSCGKDDSPDPVKEKKEDEQEENDKNTVQGKISTESVDVKVFELVTINVADTTLTGETFTGRIENDDTEEKEIKLQNIGDNQLILMIPGDVSTGSLTLTTDFASNTLSFNVSAVEIEGTADEYFNEIFDDMETLVEDLRQDAAIDPTVLSALSDNFDAIERDFNNLSAAEKQAVVRYIEANIEIIDALTISSDAPAARSGATDCSVLGNNAGAIAKTALIGAGITASVSVLSNLLLPGSGVFVGALFVKTYIAPALLDLAQGIQNCTTQYLEVLGLSLGADSNARTDGSNDFIVNTATPFPLSVQRATLDERSADSDVDWIASLVNTYVRLKGIWNTLFASDYETMDGLAQAKTGLFPTESLDYLSVTTDNPSVTGTLSGTPGNPLITFSSDLTEDTDFSFDVLYDDGDFSVSSGAQPGHLVAKKAPEITDQTFSVAEDAPIGTTVGKVQADGADGDNLTFYITSASGFGRYLFTINENTGVIILNNFLGDWHYDQTHILAIEVSDGNLSSTANITINTLPRFYMTATINGVPWGGTLKSGTLRADDVIYITDNIETYRNHIVGGFQGVWLGIDFPKRLSPYNFAVGTYPFGEYYNTTKVRGSVGDHFSSNGVVTITSVSNGIIEGIFNFTIYDRDEDYRIDENKILYQVSNGAFRMRILN